MCLDGMVMKEKAVRSFPASIPLSEYRIAKCRKNKYAQPNGEKRKREAKRQNKGTIRKAT